MAPQGDALIADVLALPAGSAAEWRERLRRGFPSDTLDAAARYTALSKTQLTRLLQIPMRTATRRHGAGQLTATESDRLFRLASVVAKAVAVLGNPQKARLWLQTPNRALGGEIPLDLLDTTLGCEQVDEVLLRINYGIVS